MDTSLIRALCSVPSVSALERFDCPVKALFTDTYVTRKTIYYGPFIWSTRDSYNYTVNNNVRWLTKHSIVYSPCTLVELQIDHAESLNEKNMMVSFERIIIIFWNFFLIDLIELQTIKITNN